MKLEAQGRTLMLRPEAYVHGHSLITFQLTATHG